MRSTIASALDWVFIRHGRKIVAGACTWELVGLVPGSPVPTISEVVEREPWFGGVILVGLAWHWWNRWVLKRLGR